MSAHTFASQESRSLCDQLFAALQQAIPKLQRSCTQASCGIYQEGHPRFAYVYHRRTASQVEIWCRGDVDELKSHDQGLGVMPRGQQRPGWEQTFPARFRIHKTDQIPAAVALLVQVSYEASR
jgi:hypothetical protein